MIYETLIDIYIKFYNFDFAILQSKGNLDRFITRLHGFYIAEAKITAPSFKNLLNNLSIPAAFTGIIFLNNSKLHLSTLAKKETIGFLYLEIFYNKQKLTLNQIY